MKNRITASPLTWPEGWERSIQQEYSRFGTYNNKISVSKATRFVLSQLRMMSVEKEDVIISTNMELRKDGLPISSRRPPEDIGVSVWWVKNKKRQVIALDKYTSVADNLHAIGKTLEAMRGIERWGGGEILNRTFTGFVALPDNSNNWRSILGNAETLDEARVFFKRKRSESHPDNGGGIEAFDAVNKAWESARNEFRG